MKQIIEMIRDANLTRHKDTYSRRLIKLSEENGEHAEAYLNVTSRGNGKGKTWDDVREEAADILIVAVDVALTVLFPAETPAYVEEQLMERLAVFDKAGVRFDSRYEWNTLRLASEIGELSLSHLRDDYQQHKLAARVVATAFDMVMTPLADQFNWTPDQLEAALITTVTTKLAKWRDNRDTGRNASDA